MKKIKILFLLLFFASGLFSETLKIVNWNVQTFFDAKTDGCEYSEFIKSKNWNVSAYEKRVERLSEMIKEIGADVYVFEEIENSEILKDIANKVSNYSWNERKNWKYSIFAKNSGDSIGCAVFSRFPLHDTTIHNIDIRSENEKQPKCRPIIKTHIKTKDSELVLFVNHWKSKSGGQEKSEKWRDYQEASLASLIEECINQGKAVLATGDFNRDIYEFNIFSNGNPNILLNGNVAVYSPWFYAEGEIYETGSYYYKDSWERIDHFFSSPSVCLKNFKTLQGHWSNDDGTPYRYKVYNGQGYSDHLPIYCEVEF